MVAPPPSNDSTLKTTPNAQRKPNTAVLVELRKQNVLHREFSVVPKFREIPEIQTDVSI
jgi:hypothetical protein